MTFERLSVKQLFSSILFEFVGQFFLYMGVLGEGACPRKQNNLGTALETLVLGDLQLRI